MLLKRLRNISAAGKIIFLKRYSSISINTLDTPIKILKRFTNIYDEIYFQRLKILTIINDAKKDRFIGCRVVIIIYRENYL